jgi:sugar/nucleoside kinase (ribokinase family)
MCTASLSPDFLAVGHVARDVVDGGFRHGGAVTYGAVTALRIGLRPAIVTSASADFTPVSSASGIPHHVAPSDRTTTFHNTYADGRRRQLLKGVAARITPADVPPGWRPAPLVLLGPLADEVDAALARHFPGSLVAADIQGWLRQWDSSGLVRPRRWEGRDVLPHVDVAVVSADDVDDDGLVELWAQVTPMLVVTLGAEGARLCHEGHWRHVPAFRTHEVDPTGAGDVFATAFLIRYSETQDPLESARFACCTASFCVEADGLDGIPTRAQVEERLSRPVP